MKKKLENFITVSKAAEILNITVPGVFAANKRGSLVIYEIEGGGSAVKLEDVLQYQKNRKVGRPKKDN